MSLISQVLPDNIKSEFSIDKNGKASATGRGTARLAGVSQEAVRKILLKLSDNLKVSKSLESFMGQNFKGDNLPDILVASIIEYYAFDAGRYCTEQAKLVYRSFAVIGFRVWTQQQLGWQKKQTQLSLENAIALANFACESAQNAGVSVALAESIKLDSVIQIAPEAEPLLVPQKKAIAFANPVPEKALTPTEIGQRLAEKLDLEKVSSRAVNKKLLFLDYQVSITRIKKSTGKEVHDYYKPTQKAIDGDYAQLEMATYKTGEGNSTKYQLRWWSAIVDVLVDNWSEK
ncbi:MAG: hypothetical protein AB4206_21280 [Xenococcaceae cyanobacterium]